MSNCACILACCQLNVPLALPSLKRCLQISDNDENANITRPRKKLPTKKTEVEDTDQKGRVFDLLKKLVLERLGYAPRPPPHMPRHEWEELLYGSSICQVSL